MLKLIKLWMLYIFYLVSFKQYVIETEDMLFYVNPEAVRKFRMDLNGARFVGSICGIDTEFNIGMDKIITIREADRE